LENFLSEWRTALRRRYHILTTKKKRTLGDWPSISVTTGKGWSCCTYQPIYFHPIEQAWSKIKKQLRSAKARTVETLQSAIMDAPGRG
jgi:hypothetical protein